MAAVQRVCAYDEELHSHGYGGQAGVAAGELLLSAGRKMFVTNGCLTHLDLAGYRADVLRYFHLRQGACQDGAAAGGGKDPAEGGHQGWEAVA